MAPRPTAGPPAADPGDLPGGSPPATSRVDVHFNLLHKDTHNRIRMIPTDPDLGPVERADLVKGFEYEKGEYIVVTQDEIESVRLESTKTIDIERFVDAADIDQALLGQPVFPGPGRQAGAGGLHGDPGSHGQDRQDRARPGGHAPARAPAGAGVRHRPDGLEPAQQDEVRDPATIDDIPDKKPDTAMIAIAQKIIEQQEGPFDPSQFNDYEDALRDLIKEKQKGKGRKVHAGAAGHRRRRPDGRPAQKPGPEPRRQGGEEAHAAKAAPKAPAKKRA